MIENKNITAYRLQIKEKIVDTAMYAFVKHGVKSVKMDDIAQTLGISKRTLYELYDNKEDLLYEGVRKYRSQRETEMLQMSSRSNNVIDVLLYVYREKVEEFKLTVPQFYADIVKYPRVMKLLDESRKKNHILLTDFLRRGVKEGVFRDDVDYHVVPVLFDAIGHYIMTYELYRQYSIEQLFKNLVFISLRGICTPLGIEKLDGSLQNY